MSVRPVARLDLWLAEAALLVAIGLQIVAWAIGSGIMHGLQYWLITTEIALAVIISFSWPHHHRSRTIYNVHRPIAFLLLALISFANIISFGSVIQMLVASGQALTGRELLAAALAIFLTNIIVFALWYWEIDSPGLTGKKWSKHDKDFQFTQQDIEADHPGWQPGFIDYLYLSLTNAINFAPADARPLSSQAKALMGIQALVSVFTLALVIARSVSILGQ